MFCTNCGAEVPGGNFCAYCGQALTETTSSVSLMNKAVSMANSGDQYNLVLVSRGSCDRTMVGDLLEDVFGYTDAESTALVNSAPVVVGERLTEREAQTIAQMLTEYGAQVSVTDENDQYVNLTSNAVKSVFDSSGNLLASVAAIIGALTVANRISSFRRYKKPSLIDRLFRIGYEPKPPRYQRNFRPHIDMDSPIQRRTIRKSPPVSHNRLQEQGHSHRSTEPWEAPRGGGRHH